MCFSSDRAVRNVSIIASIWKVLEKQTMLSRDCGAETGHTHNRMCKDLETMRAIGRPRTAT